MNNPLLNKYNTAYEVPPFNEIKISHYLPGFKDALEEAKNEVEKIIKSKDKPTFENTIIALDKVGRRLDSITYIIFNLNSASTSDEIQNISEEISPLLTEFSNNIYMDENLFKKVESISDTSNDLTEEDKTLIKETKKSFIKGGAGLDKEKKDRLRDVNSQISVLNIKFNQNVLKENNSFYLHITDIKDLKGLPNWLIETAVTNAKEKQVEGWVFTLNAPDYMSFMEYSEIRTLREKFFREYSKRGLTTNENNNEDIIRNMVNLRLEKANILGYKSYAEYVLESRMAKTPTAVNNLLNELYEASHPFAIKEKKEVEEFARNNGLNDRLEKWDWAYYCHLLKQERFAIDDEVLRPYFPLHKVEKGVFNLATKLYDITFEEDKNIPTYHKDVRAYIVKDSNSNIISVLYLDFFPRSNKSGGAWMTEYRGQSEGIIPIVSLVMNFTKPGVDKPSLLSFREVTTFLHEFGHALHGMLSKAKYNSLSGTNVYRDFVELPSQVLENWGYEKEWLDTWASHYISGEKIPAEYIERIKASANFITGYSCDRQLGFGFLDMAFHSLETPIDCSIVNFEKKAIEKINIMPEVENTCISTAFSHIFGGGYAAGYYGYKWAEVLDADAFSVFQKNGIFDKSTADSFKKNILEKGGTENPMVLYKRFKGEEPSITALLKRSGMLAFD